MDLLYSLPENILQRIEFLKQDYIGITLDIKVFNIFFVSLAFALFLTLLSYSFGKKISAPFNGKRENAYDYLFFIAVGYILIGTGIAFLGFLVARIDIKIVNFCEVEWQRGINLSSLHTNLCGDLGGFFVLRDKMI